MRAETIGRGVSLRSAGMVCLLGGLIGVAQAIVLMVIPDMSPGDRYSDPLSATGYTIAQVSFFAQHLLLLVGLVSLLGLAAVRASRVARIGIVMGSIGMALLAVMELVAISARNVGAESDRADLINSLYGIPTILCGLGFVIGGIALVRVPKQTWVGPAWLRIVVLLLGLWVFVPLLPAIMGPDVLARLAIGGWMALFAVLGWGLSRTPASEAERSPRGSDSGRHQPRDPLNADVRLQ